MKSNVIILIILLILSGNAIGQEYQLDNKAKEEISKLSFLVGNWEGSGWSMGRDGQKHSFEQTEKITFKLDSTAILIEGLGKAEGATIHNALAVISYNKDENNYRFKSWLSSGRGGEFKAEIRDGKFYWFPNDNMRYIIWINEQAQWQEIGEMKQNGEWFQFFEMTLDKSS